MKRRKGGRPRVKRSRVVPRMAAYEPDEIDRMLERVRGRTELVWPSVTPFAAPKRAMAG